MNAREYEKKVIEKVKVKVNKRFIETIKEVNKVVNFDFKELEDYLKENFNTESEVDSIEDLYVNKIIILKMKMRDVMSTLKNLEDLEEELQELSSVE